MSGGWPFPGDSPLARARKVTWAYREALLRLERDDLVGELDDRFTGWGEWWISPERTYQDDDWVPAIEAGQLIGVSAGAISNLRVHGRIVGQRDGRRYLYKVADVYALSAHPRVRKAHSTDRVPDDGRSLE